MTETQTKYCTVVRGFLDETTINTMAQYMENKLKLENWHTRPEGSSYEDCPSEYLFYADPLAEVVLVSSVPQIEEITKKKVFPTYSYSRIYVKGDELTPHVDRPSCEISVTINIANVGGIWPIWMQAPGEKPMKVDLNPGDAVVYRGCEVTHWREKMVDQDVIVQFMLHYVDQNGPNAERKWDTRPGIGYLASTRRF